MIPSNRLTALLSLAFCALVFPGLPASVLAQEDVGKQDTPGEEEQAMTDMPVIKLRSLDKVTARTVTFEANVGSTLKFGSLYIKTQSCRKSSPLESPEATAFLQVWEVNAQEKASWVFSGWMFASSPGLSSMDHPIYDVWVLDCLENKSEEHDHSAEKDARGEGELPAEKSPAEPAIKAP